MHNGINLEKKWRALLSNVLWFQSSVRFRGALFGSSLFSYCLDAMVRNETLDFKWFPSETTVLGVVRSLT